MKTSHLKSAKQVVAVTAPLLTIELPNLIWLLPVAVSPTPIMETPQKFVAA